MAFAVSIAALVGCGRSDPNGPLAPLVPPAARSLVGTWEGILKQPHADDHELTMLLLADSTVSTQTPGLTSRCATTGVWTVSAGQLTATARDVCDGAAVTFVAPVGTDRLLGTWSMGTNQQGSFDVAKR